MRRTVLLVCAVVSYESMFFTVLSPLLPHLAEFGIVAPVGRKDE